MLIYIITFALSIILIGISELKKTNHYVRNACIITAILAPSILAGVRDYSIGVDVLNYGNIWFYRANGVTNLWDYLQSANRQSVGPGYALLNYLVTQFTDNPHWFYFFLALIEILLVYFAVKQYRKTISIPLSLCIYFFLYYNDSLNILRQYPAVLIVLYSLKYIRSRRLLPFFICVLLASSFHVTAIIGAVLYPVGLLSESRIRKEFYYLMIIGVVAISAGLDSIISIISSYGIIRYDRFASYTAGEYVVGGRYLRFLLYGMQFFLFLLNKKRIEKKYNHTNIFFSICTISLIMSLLPFIYQSAYIVRIAYYFDVFSIVYMPLVADNMKIRLWRKNTWKWAMIIMIYFTYWIFVYIVRNGAATYPYLFMQS